MPGKTIDDFLKNSAAQWPDNAAVTKGDEQLTYEDIY
jgi:non-ribosomal peptide synthetase component E (peptide arylation enzyme)